MIIACPHKVGVRNFEPATISQAHDLRNPCPEQGRRVRQDDLLEMLNRQAKLRKSQAYNQTNKIDLSQWADKERSAGARSEKFTV